MEDALKSDNVDQRTASVTISKRQYFFKRAWGSSTGQTHSQHLKTAHKANQIN